MKNYDIKRLRILTRAFSSGELSLINHFWKLVQAQPFPILRKSTLSTTTKQHTPDIILAFCDYHCSAARCWDKFRFIKMWDFIPSLLVKPILLKCNGDHHSSFIITILGQGEGANHDFSAFFSQLNHASCIACSPSWSMHCSSQIYKIAKIQIFVSEGDADHNKERLLAKQVGWSPPWLSSRFRRHAGITLEQLIIKNKTCKALWQLLASDKSIKEISYNSGYHNPSYFYKQFKKHFVQSAAGIRRRA